MKRTTLAILLCLTATRAFADPVATPGMAGPLAANPNPYNFDAGPLGKVYVTGAVSGLGLWQSNPIANNDTTIGDLDNAHLVVQTTEGLVQFYVQAGAYTMPSLGAPYFYVGKSTGDFYGPVPVAYVKLAPSDHFSVQAGKLYTLIGAENTFTFMNSNTERGLLWNQTNAVNRGVQVNYSQGSLSGSVAWSDGFYSDEMNWLSGLLTYTIDPSNSFTVIASGSLHSDSEATVATPLAQNNSQIYDLVYSHTSGPWTISPVLQFTYVPQRNSVGIANAASSYGAALNAKYTIDPNWSVAARAEYIDTVGNVTNLAYGPGSNAWSITVTPTWQQGIYYIRPEASFVKATDTTPGAAFGSSGNDSTQGRLLVETGVLF